MFMWKIKLWWPLSSNQQTTISMETLRGCLSTSWHRGTIIAPPVRLPRTKCCASTSPKSLRTRTIIRQHVTGQPQVCHSTIAPLQFMGHQFQRQMASLNKLLLSINACIAAQIPVVSKLQHKRLPRNVIHVYTRHAPLIYRKIRSFYVATYWHWMYFQLHIQSPTLK